MAGLAAQYPRNEKGWIVFPDDSRERPKLFCKEGTQHLAKANMSLVTSLIEYTSSPGDTIADITAGTGTILLGSKMGRRVVCIELNPVFVGWIRQNAKKMQLSTGSWMVLEGDCRKLLPIRGLQSILFSPPYSTLLNKAKMDATISTKFNEDILLYGKMDEDLAALPPYFYNQAMQEVYTKCYQSLKVGGWLGLIIKDMKLGGERVPLGLRAVQMMQKAGFKVTEWHRRQIKETYFTALNRKKGVESIDDEHIILCRKGA